MLLRHGCRLTQLLVCVEGIIDARARIRSGYPWWAIGEMDWVEELNRIKEEIYGAKVA